MMALYSAWNEWYMQDYQPNESHESEHDVHSFPTSVELIKVSAETQSNDSGASDKVQVRACASPMHHTTTTIRKKKKKKAGTHPAMAAPVDLVAHKFELAKKCVETMSFAHETQEQFSHRLSHACQTQGLLQNVRKLKATQIEQLWRMRYI